MNATRLLTRPEKDGELLLTGLPIAKAQLFEVIILSQEAAKEEDPVLSLLQHDPGYAFLREAAEDLYTVADIKEAA
ncbi:MAG: hypothetical protein NT169_25435 [Chloroflexi bacterium]|nr:hypothetical protein [Chloroflexota bacterium]